METTAGNLVNFINQPITVQDGFRKHMGIVLSVTEREDGFLDIPLHFDDETGFHLVSIVEAPKDWPVSIMEEM